MARKMKHKAKRKAKGLRHSRRVKAAMPKPVGKKNKKANRKRAEARVPLGEAFRKQNETLIPGEQKGSVSTEVTDFETGVASPVNFD